MTYILATDQEFDAKVLAVEYNTIFTSVKADQINLRKPSTLSDIEGITYGSGSLVKDGKIFDNDRSWDSYITSLGNSYTIEVLKEIEKYVGYVYSARVGRARYMSLRQKSCLTYHIDQDNVMRIHIPIITNSNCFFVNEDTVGRMEIPGKAYIFNSSVKHTAVNASRESRVHLVVNCYR
jgi:hypothetical protein